MINIVGIFIVILGFFALSISDGKLSPIFFFWFGFLFLLWPNKYTQRFSEWMKLARIGLIIQWGGSMFVLLFAYFLVNTSPYLDYLGSFFSWSFRIFHCLTTPVSTVIEYFFPYPQTKLPDGGVRISFGYFRTTLTDSFDVLTYLFLGIGIGKLRKNYMVGSYPLRKRIIRRSKTTMEH